MKINDAILEALRPAPVELDPEWSNTTLRSILATEQTTPRKMRTRRRVGLTAFVVATTSVAGMGVAAASTGFSFKSFTETFGYWNTTPVEGHPDVDPASATRIASATGPNNSVFSVLGTDGDYACFTAVLESTTSAKAALPSDFTDITSNYCGAFARAEFGLDGVSYTNGVAGYMVHAGEAVRATVTSAKGTEYPALLVDGLFWGWFPEGEHPTLTAYAEDGTVVGRERL